MAAPSIPSIPFCWPRWMDETGPIPVNLITGFLGSGKTTLLRKILASPAFANAAVLINEFGEAGLDHLLVERIDNTTVLLENGCICCSVRDDLKAALVALIGRRRKNGVPAFDRVLIETTGLADPVPVIATLMQDMMLRHHFRLGNVVVTVDAVHGLKGLQEHVQVARQVAVADRILLTKTDLASTNAVSRLRKVLTGINSSAPVEYVPHGATDPARLIEDDVYDPATKSGEVARWLLDRSAEAPAGGGLRLSPNAAAPRQFRAEPAVGAAAHELPATLSITLHEPVEWAAFGLWLSLIVGRHGDRVLRIKGIVDVEGSETPVVVHGVQSLLHPAEHLPEWPAGPRATRLVLIVHGLDARLFEPSLRAFLALGLKTRS